MDSIFIMEFSYVRHTHMHTHTRDVTGHRCVINNRRWFVDGDTALVVVMQILQQRIDFGDDDDDGAVSSEGVTMTDNVSLQN